MITRTSFLRQWERFVDARPYSSIFATGRHGRGEIGAALRNVAAPAFNAATIFSANGNTRDSTNVGQLCVFVVTIFTKRNENKRRENGWKRIDSFFFLFFSSRNCGPHCVSGKRKHRIITKRVDRFRHRHSRDDCFASFLRFISVQGTYKLRIITTIASRRRKLTVIKSRIASERDPSLKRERERRSLRANPAARELDRLAEKRVARWVGSQTTGEKFMERDDAREQSTVVGRDSRARRSREETGFRFLFPPSNFRLANRVVPPPPFSIDR